MTYKFQRIAAILAGGPVSVEEAADLRGAVKQLPLADQRILTLYASGYTAAEALKTVGVFANPERYVERLVRRVVLRLNGGEGGETE